MLHFLKYVLLWCRSLNYLGRMVICVCVFVFSCLQVCVFVCAAFVWCVTLWPLRKWLLHAALILRLLWRDSVIFSTMDSTKPQKALKPGHDCTVIEPNFFHKCFQIAFNHKLSVVLHLTISYFPSSIFFSDQRNVTDCLLFSSFTMAD